MNEWKVGPKEKQVAVILTDVRTIYTDWGPVVIYIGNGAFHAHPAAEEAIEREANEIARALNTLKRRPVHQSTD